jgi:hypothetical protein
VIYPFVKKEINVQHWDLTLVEIIRSPNVLLCEASELTLDGHYYLYQYNGREGNFYRATIPSGAGYLHFRLLKANDKIPLSGWRIIEKSEVSDRY